MNDLLHEFTTEVGDEDGHRYLARAMGRQRKGATVWEGWLEFSPRGGGGVVRKSPIETTQPNREALVYWASGLERAYLGGGLERAITARIEGRARSKWPERGAITTVVIAVRGAVRAMRLLARLSATCGAPSAPGP